MISDKNSRTIQLNSGNFEEYLDSLRRMLPFFAATGHDKYLRSIRWYLDEMDSLPADVKDQFNKGNFVVRRQDQFYGATSGDYTIETTLMNSFKGKSGNLVHYYRISLLTYQWLKFKPIMENKDFIFCFQLNPDTSDR